MRRKLWGGSPLSGRALGGPKANHLYSGDVIGHAIQCTVFDFQSHY